MVQLPAISDYWATSSRIPYVADAMPIRRFKNIRRYLHFNDNSAIIPETKYRFYKVRTVIEKIQNNCQEFCFEDKFSIDETMIPYKGTYAGTLSQYIKNKPHKWGFKFFVRAGVSGFIYDFIPNQGSFTLEEL